MEYSDQTIMETDLRLTSVYQSLFRFPEVNMLPQAALETMFLHLRLAYYLGHIHHYNKIVPYLNLNVPGLDLPLQDVD